MHGVWVWNDAFGIEVGGFGMQDVGVLGSRGLGLGGFRVLGLRVSGCRLGGLARDMTRDEESGQLRTLQRTAEPRQRLLEGSCNLVTSFNQRFASFLTIPLSGFI